MSHTDVEGRGPDFKVSIHHAEDQAADDDQGA